MFCYIMLWVKPMVNEIFGRKYLTCEAYLQDNQFCHLYMVKQQSSTQVCICFCIILFENSQLILIGNLWPCGPHIHLKQHVVVSFCCLYILKKEIILVVVVSWLILHFHFDFHIVEMSPIACILLFIKFHLHVWLTFFVGMLKVGWVLCLWLLVRLLKKLVFIL